MKLKDDFKKIISLKNRRPLNSKSFVFSFLMGIVFFISYFTDHRAESVQIPEAFFGTKKNLCSRLFLETGIKTKAGGESKSEVLYQTSSAVFSENFITNDAINTNNAIDKMNPETKHLYEGLLDKPETIIYLVPLQIEKLSTFFNFFDEPTKELFLKAIKQYELDQNRNKNLSQEELSRLFFLKILFEKNYSPALILEIPNYQQLGPFNKYPFLPTIENTLYKKIIQNITSEQREKLGNLFNNFLGHQSKAQDNEEIGLWQLKGPKLVRRNLEVLLSYIYEAEVKSLRDDNIPRSEAEALNLINKYLKKVSPKGPERGAYDFNLVLKTAQFIKKYLNEHQLLNKTDKFIELYGSFVNGKANLKSSDLDLHLSPLFKEAYRGQQFETYDLLFNQLDFQLKKLPFFKAMDPTSKLISILLTTPEGEEVLSDPKRFAAYNVLSLRIFSDRMELLIYNEETETLKPWFIFMDK